MIYPHTGPLWGLQTCAHSNQALVYPQCVSHALYSIVSRSSVLYLQLLLLSPVARSSADTVNLKESSDLQHISISVANTVVSLNPKLTRHLQHFCPAFFSSTKVFTLSLCSISSGGDSQGSEGELLLGEVEGVVGHRDAIRTGVLSVWQIPPQNGVVGDAEEGHHAVPRHVVEPHLQK